MRLALDHHYSTKIADQLRARDHDVVAAVERGWHLEEDESLLALCHGEQRTLLTNNVADFAFIARQWAAEGRSHSGLIFTSDAAMPRGRNTIGRYVTVLDEILISHRGTHPLDQVLWL